QLRCSAAPDPQLRAAVRRPLRRGRRVAAAAGEASRMSPTSAVPLAVYGVLIGITSAVLWVWTPYTLPPALLSGGALLFLVVAALLPPLDAAADEQLSVHMVQHLLIVFVAAPLIVAGAPIRVALRHLPRGGRDALVRLLHSRLAHVLGHPVVAWSVFAAAIVG